MVGVAPAATGQGVRVAGESGAHGGGERGKQATVALAQMHLSEDGLLSVAEFGGSSELEEEFVATDLEGRSIEELGSCPR